MRDLHHRDRAREAITATGGCPKGNINALKDGIVTRAILFDATLLPGKATAQGWLEPGTAIHREDLEVLEKLEHVNQQATSSFSIQGVGSDAPRSALGQGKPGSPAITPTLRTS
jgi:hypothetical protein